MGLGLRDLRVWQEATGLAADTLRSLGKTPIGYRAFADRTIVTAAAVAEHVADGFGEKRPEQREGRFRSAKMEMLKRETQLAIATTAELLPRSRHADLAARIATVNRLLSGFLVYLDRQANEREETEVQSP
jgi:hypothetical protein